MLVSELSACDADRMPSKSTVPVVSVERRWGLLSALPVLGAAAVSSCPPSVG